MLWSATRKSVLLADHMFEAADFAPPAQRQRQQADVVCSAGQAQGQGDGTRS
ncbi:hypothetical protein [Streptomyces sp. CB03234]|uniref:hypothetical protein n=1 Tax=Streptomyces sp. (strain CB03234) TaxID=1703937 RepID=UPI00130173F4|nr:hypothetical protein [Streptomyces sp. CB03234]